MNISEITRSTRMSTGSALILAVVSFGLYSSIVHAEDVMLELSGAQQVPAVNSAGTGMGEISVAEDGSVSGSVTTRDIVGTVAHIHMGAMGKNGPPAITLTKAGNTYSVPANTKLTTEQHESFKQGNLYVNVHTVANPDGELRGQLTP